MGSSQRTQGRAWPLQQAAKGNGVGRIARYAEQLQGLVGVVALTVRSPRTLEDEIPVGIVTALLGAPFIIPLIKRAYPASSS